MCSQSVYSSRIFIFVRFSPFFTILSEAGLRQVTCIVRERQLRLYGHVARLSTENSAHRILFCRDPRGWIMPRCVHTLHGCDRWSSIWGIWVLRSWRLPGRWPDGGRRSTMPHTWSDGDTYILDPCFSTGYQVTPPKSYMYWWFLGRMVISGVNGYLGQKSYLGIPK